MSVTQRVDDMVKEFQKFSDWEDRYKYIIKLGKELPPLNKEYQIDANKVRGCQSQVWLHAELHEGQVLYSADSDAAIVKGIISLLLRIYSDSTPDEILSVPPTFLDKIGLREHLSMSRANGLTAMIKQISFYAIAFKAKLAAATS